MSFDTWLVWLAPSFDRVDDPIPDDVEWVSATSSYHAALQWASNQGIAENTGPVVVVRDEDHFDRKVWALVVSQEPRPTSYQAPDRLWYVWQVEAASEAQLPRPKHAREVQAPSACEAAKLWAATHASESIQDHGASDLVVESSVEGPNPPRTMWDVYETNGFLEAGSITYLLRGKKK